MDATGRSRAGREASRQGLRSVVAGVAGATFIRHVALLLATLAVWALREPLRAGNAFLWIIGLAAVLNLVPVVFRRLARSGVWSSSSFVLGIAAWTALVKVSGGVESPFVAGYWLEIMLSAVALRASAPLLASLASVAALWLQHFFPGQAAVVEPLVLHSAFLVAMGVVAFYVKFRWTRAHGDLASRHAGLRTRLARLERELDDARVLGEVGHNVARLAHGLKNTVHALRGFTGLLESRVADSDRDRQLMNGLTQAIDRLDEIARDCMGPRSGVTQETVSRSADTQRVLREAIGEVEASHPAMRWRARIEADLPDVEVPPAVLREVATILAQNAAEAMEGQGVASVVASRQAGQLRVEVRDRGPGLAPEVRSNLFKPGFTTKPDGNGFGLYLARRLLEPAGGTLSTRPDATGGSRFTVTVPSRET